MRLGAWLQGPLDHRSLVHVEFDAANSTAELDDLLWPSSGTKIIPLPAGASQVSFRLYAIPDRKDEGSEEAAFRLARVGNEQYTVPSASTDLSHLALITIVDSSLEISDSADPERGLVLSPGRSMSVAEGASAAYTVRLASAPDHNVLVRPYVRTERPVDITVTDAALTFTPSNWRVPQTVTVTAPSGSGSGRHHVIGHAAHSNDDDYHTSIHLGGPGVDRGLHMVVTVTGGTQPAGDPRNQAPPPAGDQNPPHVGPDDSQDPDGEVPEGPDEGPGSGGPTSSNEGPGQPEELSPQQTYAALIAQMRQWRDDPQWKSNKAHTDRWDRALLAFGETVADTSLPAMGAAEAQGYADRGWTRWTPVAQALNAIESG